MIKAPREGAGKEVTETTDGLHGESRRGRVSEFGRLGGRNVIVRIRSSGISPETDFGAQ